MAAMSSSTETKVPANVPRNSPYRSVSFTAIFVASEFVSAPTFLNFLEKEKKLEGQKKILSKMVPLNKKSNRKSKSPAALQSDEDREEGEAALEPSADCKALAGRLQAPAKSPPLLRSRTTARDLTIVAVLRQDGADGGGRRHLTREKEGKFEKRSDWPAGSEGKRAREGEVFKL